MTQPIYLTNARIVLPDEILERGSLTVDEDKIAAIDSDSKPANAVEFDLQGAWLMPGIIDLHADAIESIAEPRPGAYLPFDYAAAQIDRIVAMAGITTFYNSISFAGEELGLRNEKAGSQLVEAIHEYRSHALVDQRVHCRFEVTCGNALPDILSFIERGVCQLVSFMDHSPGQGQFQTEQSYREYMRTRYGYDVETIDRMLSEKQAVAGEVRSYIKQLSAAATKASIPLAGHDSDSVAQVEQMAQAGVTLCEFPMNLEAARAGHEAGFHQLVGSTNVLRGGSQRTGMAAADLIAAGLADCLCSDYVPSTILPAVFKIAQDQDMPLHQAAQLATRNPAAAAQLHDRGIIAAGMRADLIAVEWLHNQPLVTKTWSAGRQAFSCSR